MELFCDFKLCSCESWLDQNDIKQTEYTSLDMCFSIYQFGERHFQFCCFLIVEWPQSEHWDSWVCSVHLGVCWLYTIFSEPWNISFPLKLNVDKDQKPYSNYFMNSKCEHNDKGSRGRKQTGMSSDTLSQIFFRHPRKLKPMTSKTQLCLTLKKSCEVCYTNKKTSRWRYIFKVNNVFYLHEASERALSWTLMSQVPPKCSFVIVQNRCDHYLHFIFVKSFCFIKKKKRL